MDLRNAIQRRAADVVADRDPGSLVLLMLPWDREQATATLRKVTSMAVEAAWVDDILTDLSGTRGDKGFTILFDRTISPTSGYVVSPYKHEEQVFSLQYLIENPDTLHDVYDNFYYRYLNQRGHYFGAWVDPRTGMVYFDIVIHTYDREEAERLAVQHNQIAYFDLNVMDEVRVGRTALLRHAGSGRLRLTALRPLDPDR